MPAVEPTPRSIAALTDAVFGEALSLSGVFTRLGVGRPRVHNDPREGRAAVLWVGSVGYELFKESGDFAARLAAAGVERLVDVRELPISRQAMPHAGAGRPTADVLARRVRDLRGLIGGSATRAPAG